MSLLITSLSQALEFVKNPATVAACEKTMSKMKSEALVNFDFFDVPLDRQQATNSNHIKIFYWIKKGTNSKKTPLLLIHGGPGGNSWRYYEAYKNSKYEGDVISIDNRNEGCSHVLDYNLPPESYSYFRARQVVEDIEVLHKNLYPNQTWRVFGQSRGSAIAHYYLEMYPRSLESVATQGFAMMSLENTLNYTYMRSQFNARGSERFAAQFPEAAQVIVEAKNIFNSKNICLPMNFLQQNLPVENRYPVCGDLITDSISYKLSNYSRWKDIATSLVALKMADGSIDEAKVKAFFTAEIDGNIYVQFMNYIMGTNGMDVGSPAPRNFTAIDNDVEISKSLISEGRFVSKVVYQAFLSTGNDAFLGYSDQADFKKIKKFLRSYKNRNGKSFNLTLFASKYDTIAGPEMYNYEKGKLGDLANFVELQNSGHEAWQTEKQLTDFLIR